MTPAGDGSSQVISTFGFYGWMEGAMIRVAVLARVLPDDRAQRGGYRGLPDTLTAETVTLKEIATYTLSMDKPTPIVAMKALGLTPMILTVGVGQPPWPRAR